MFCHADFAGFPCSPRTASPGEGNSRVNSSTHTSPGSNNSSSWPPENDKWAVVRALLFEEASECEYAHEEEEAAEDGGHTLGATGGLAVADEKPFGWIEDDSWDWKYMGLEP
jgi:hypothetical protein